MSVCSACYPPPMHHSIFLGTTLLGGGVILLSSRSGADFASPVTLTSGGTALGGTIRYPSPQLVDVDGDGARELIVGDLSGLVRVTRPVGRDDELAWGELTPLITDGRELKFNNW